MAIEGAIKRSKMNLVQFKSSPYNCIVPLPNEDATICAGPNNLAGGPREVLPGGHHRLCPHLQPLV